MEELRDRFIEYQKQFYREDRMQDLIEQSDQNQAILKGKYDSYIHTILYKLWKNF